MKLRLLIIVLSLAAFLLFAPAMAHANAVYSNKEISQAARAFIKQCNDDVRASQSAQKARHLNERLALDKPVNSQEYRALLKQQKKQRQAANAAHRENKKRARKQARLAIKQGQMISPYPHRTNCYRGDR